MSTADAKLLLISNPEERDEIETLLASGGFASIVHAEGGDHTIRLFDELTPDVVVMCADLAQGDARSLAAQLRERPSSAGLILVGQTVGPIRNALDATDFRVDQFVGRPLAAKALLFAVGRCVARVREERSMAPPKSPPVQSLGDGAVVTRARTQSLIDDAMDQAIDAFVDDAIASLPYDALLDSIAEAVPVAAPDQETNRMAGVAAVTLDREGEPDEASQTTSPTGWREQTVVLGPDRPAPAASPAPASSEESGGGFARELRRKMSQMANRLFPGEEERSADLHGVLHNAHTEIDLTDLGDPATLGPHDFEPTHAVGSADLDDDSKTQVPLDRADTGTHARIRRPSAAPVSGTLDSQGNDVASVLARLFDLGVTGRVAFRNAGAERVIFLDRGRPVFATSNLPHDRMGDLLFREGKMTREQHIRSRELVAESGRRMGEILVAEGFLKPKELMPAVRRHLEDLLYSLFAWGEGDFEVEEEVLPSSERIRLTRHPAALILEGIRRKFDMPRLARLFGSPDPALDVVSDERVRALSQQLELLPEEERAIERFDGRSTLAAIAEDVGSDTLSVAQVGFALVALGAASVVGETLTSQEEVTQSRAEPADADAEIDRERIRAKYELVLESDYFRFLGVRRDSSAFEIRRAYQSAVRDFAPDGFPVEVRRDMSGELEAIRAVLDEAVAVLGNDRVRSAYLHNLRD